VCGDGASPQTKNKKKKFSGAAQMRYVKMERSRRLSGAAQMRYVKMEEQATERQAFIQPRLTCFAK
jgi:hypothetical protein